jgi:hypothetical protein
MGLNLDTMTALPPGTHIEAVGQARPRFNAGLKMNATTRGFDLDSTGRYVEDSPNSAAVVSTLLTLKGKLRSAPSVGVPLHQVTPTDGGRTPDKIRDMVELALARFVRAKRISIVTIASSPTTFGGINVEVEWLDLELRGANQKQTTAVVI